MLRNLWVRPAQQPSSDRLALLSLLLMSVGISGKELVIVAKFVNGNISKDLLLTAKLNPNQRRKRNLHSGKNQRNLH